VSIHAFAVPMMYWSWFGIWQVLHLILLINKTKTEFSFGNHDKLTQEERGGAYMIEWVFLMWNLQSSVYMACDPLVGFLTYA